MPQDLLESVDRYSRERGKSRAAFIREACQTYIAARCQEELRRRYIEGYRQHPEPAEDSAWRISLAGAVWGEEDWNEEDW